MTQNVSITTGAHPQNGVMVKMINILNQQYVFSDKRGRSQSKTITASFAKEIIDAVPSAHYYADRMTTATDITLSWDYLTGGGIELRLHGPQGHIYTSLPQ